MTGPIINVDPGEEHGAANHFRALAADFNGYEPDDGDSGDYPSHHAARGLRHAIKRTGRVGDRLSATGDGTTDATNSLDQQDQENGQQISAVGEGLDMSGMAAMISAFSQPAGQVIAGVSQGANALLGAGTQAAAQVGGQMLNAGASLAKNTGTGSAAPASLTPDAGAGIGGGAGAAPTEPAGGRPLGPERHDNTRPEPGRPVSYQNIEPVLAVNPRMGSGAPLGMVRPPVANGGNEKEDKAPTRKIIVAGDDEPQPA